MNKPCYFTREGMDVRSKTDIDAYTSIYGGKVEVKDLHGQFVKVDIPPGKYNDFYVCLFQLGIRLPLRLIRHLGASKLAYDRVFRYGVYFSLLLSFQ